jgi:hypothetical protein
MSDLAPRPRPEDGEAYRAYALISNSLAAAFHEAGLFVLLSRREHMATLVWNELVSRELRMPL